MASKRWSLYSLLSFYKFNLFRDHLRWRKLTWELKHLMRIWTLFDCWHFPGISKLPAGSLRGQISVEKQVYTARHLLISNYFLGISSASVRTWRSSNHLVMCPKSCHSNCDAASWRPEPFPKRCTKEKRCWQRFSRSLPGISVSRPWPRWPHVLHVRVCPPSDPAATTAAMSWRAAWLTMQSWQIAGTNI